MACALMWRSWVEPVVIGAQIGSSFFDTGLLMVVKNYYSHSNSSVLGPTHDAVQRAISNFYLIFGVITGLCPLASAYILGWLGDKKHRKITICVPLIGYFFSRLFLLPVILLGWPLEVMYGSAALNGLTGGFTAYWAGVMTLGSLGSPESGRSRRLIIFELTYGLAGFFGSLVSGHIFVRFNVHHHHGTVLVCCSLACYFFCVVYSIFVLNTPETRDRNSENCPFIQDNSETSGDGSYRPEPAPEQSERTKLLEGNPRRNPSRVQTEGSIVVPPSKVILALLFAGGILYSIAAGGSTDVLNLFLIKDPLNWGPVEIGYGNAAGNVIFISSFLGVFIFSRFMRDITMIMIGIVSFSAGICIMAFVRWTFLFYVARAVMLFSLIPLSTVRSLLSKHVKGSSYGKLFVILQLAITVTGVVTSFAYIKIYQATLDWFAGFCFLLSCFISAISIIPFCIISYKQSEPARFQNSPAC